MFEIWNCATFEYETGLWNGEPEALFIEPQWDAAIGPPKGVGYDSVLKEEESELIPPLSKRLKRAPPDVTPVTLQRKTWKGKGVK